MRLKKLERVEVGPLSGPVCEVWLPDNGRGDPAPGVYENGCYRLVIERPSSSAVEDRKVGVRE
ncbi:hypothetical protein FRUB_05971 [Fimbriiglobus ruber]|uniref:Uncharacterized protein n=1 Tax=Fimbriiglobus ruber TaxID=1908690 RepID=A0A225DLH7_9BACT|nr:hypothetical protein FRUB_05971 [Fimbriiglobus ruber]